MKLGLRQEGFSVDGKYFKISKISIRPSAVTLDLTDRMNGANICPQTGDIKAKAGSSMLIIPQKSWTRHMKDYEAYQVSCVIFGTLARRPIITAWIYSSEEETA